MFCSKCGTNNIEGSKFCFKCGAELISDDAAQQDAVKLESTVSREPFEPIPPKNSVASETAEVLERVVQTTLQRPDFEIKNIKSKKIPIILGVVAVIVVVIIIASNSGNSREGLNSRGIEANEDREAIIVASNRGNSPEELNNQGVTALEANNYQQAVELFRRAADQGLADAQFNLCVMYENGQGVTQDYRQAVEWYRKAADQGLAGAQNYLGIMYADGIGVPKDENIAI